MTVQGLGASLSPVIGGWIAQGIGYSAMFLVLGSFALGSIALWLGFASVVRADSIATDHILDGGHRRRHGVEHRQQSSDGFDRGDHKSNRARSRISPARS
jgi:MFS family permease